MQPGPGVPRLRFGVGSAPADHARDGAYAEYLVVVEYTVLPYAHSLDPDIEDLKTWGIQYQRRLETLPVAAERGRSV